MHSKMTFRFTSLAASAIALTACGGGGGGSAAPPPPATYSIGGTVTGLVAGTSVVLQNNSGNNLTVGSAGSFTFSTELTSGTAYAVTVLTQPTTPGAGQTCTVASGSGTVGTADITNVAVTCVKNDATPPTVTARKPLATAIGSQIQGDVVTVTFDSAIDTSTVTASSFSVQGPAGAVAGGISFAAGNTQAIFTPTTRLAYDASYTVTLTTAVTDLSANALAANVVWSFNTGKKLAVGWEHTCARLDDGSVKCWGRNDFGQLGYGDTTDRGDSVGTSTSALAAVNLGAGRTAVSLIAGDYHNCAILDNGDTKCWGLNLNGQLGQFSAAGTLSRIGDAAGEMAALLPVNLGTGRRALEITAGQNFTCARLDDNSVKCWGLNTSGQLGQGNTASLGIANGDIAAATAVSLGTGLTPIQLSLGHYHSCAILRDASGNNHTKCWGDNRWGQLGQGNTVSLGDNGGEMGDALPEIDFGTGLTASYLMATGGHSCVILSNQAVKCWGLNTWGAVGLDLGNSAPALGAPQLLCSGGARDCIGDTPGELGNALTSPIAAGAAVKLSLGFRHSCVVIANGDLKCWGSNEEGQLGLGTNAGANLIIGDAAGEIAGLVPTALKPSTEIEELSGGGFHTCILNDDDTVNCWGNNNRGQLGHNDTAIWGDGAGEMGVNLPDLDLGP